MGSLKQLEDMLEAEKRLRAEVEAWQKTREAEVLKEIAASIVDDWLHLSGFKAGERG